MDHRDAEAIRGSLVGEGCTGGKKTRRTTTLATHSFGVAGRIHACSSSEFTEPAGESRCTFQVGKMRLRGELTQVYIA